MEEITLKELLSLISDLTDESDCRFDHKGFCQEHLWSHKRAKQLLDAQDKQHFRFVIEVHDEI